MGVIPFRVILEREHDDIQSVKPNLDNHAGEFPSVDYLHALIGHDGAENGAETNGRPFACDAGMLLETMVKIADRVTESRK